jgi:hypothetical protein
VAAVAGPTTSSSAAERAVVVRARDTALNRDVALATARKTGNIEGSRA